MLYSIAKPWLFKLNAERAHDFTLKNLKRLERSGLLNLYPRPPKCQTRKVMGLEFPNPVGLAAGLDKNGAYIDALSMLGFGFIEIGTITPRAQPGNPKPRMFRLPEAEGIINRFGFNNLGVEALLRNVAAAKYQGILGINIGKNFDTPNEKAQDDYLHCLRKVYAHASYVTVNISSPNTKNLRALQEKDALADLLRTLKAEQQVLADQHGRYVPIALKIAPDLDATQIADIASLLMENRFDGVIATNTTLARDLVQGLPHAEETGGLSGAPVRDRSTAVIKALSEHLQGALPIIGVGGILGADDAAAKIAAGASLVQIYSGLVYRGPVLVSEVCHKLG